ncbi:MAG: 30S ribosomal protein S15 [Elusimicrobiota bacterium]
MTKSEKSDIVGRHGANAKDSGSTAVQIALMTKRMETLSEHLKKHKYDHSSRRGLLMIVGRRRSYLRYLQGNDPEAFKKLNSALGLG